MKTILFYKHGLFLILILFSTICFGQLFTQDFNSSPLVSNYVSATSPTNGHFNSISTSGAGTVLSITGGQLRFTRTGNAGSYSRTTNFSPTPTSLIYKFDVTVSGNSSAATTAAIWQVGSGYGVFNSAEPNANTHSRIGLNISGNPGGFSLRDLESTTNSTTFSGKQTITWYINNSGGSLTYTAPDASIQTVANDTFDVWIGTTLTFNDAAATTAALTLTDLKFAFSGGNATIDLDNIIIDTFPTNLPTLATGGINSLSGFTYNEGTGPSTSQFFTLYASNLTPAAGSITISPPADYEISNDDITFTSSTISVSYAAGSIPQTPVTKIFVRLKAGLSANTYNGESISIAGGAAPSITVACNGVINKSDIVLTALSGTEMNYPLGSGPSMSVSAKVSGTFLTGNVTIVPNDISKWEVSTDATVWKNAAVYVPVGGILKASENKIYVRLKQGLAVGTYAGTATASSAYAVDEILSFSGEVLQPLIQINSSTQAVSLSGFNYDFAQGPSAVQNVKIDGTNLNGDITATASANWEISTNLTYDGGNSFPFSIVSFKKNNLNQVSNKTLYIRMRDGLSVGPYTGSVTFTSANAVSKTVNLSGTVFPGKVDMKVLGGLSTINDGSTVPSSLNRTQFATRNIGNSQTKTYTITNRGGANLIVGEITITGVNNIDFAVVNPPLPGTIMAQNGTLDFDIIFEPTTVGPKIAKVEIENNDPDNNPYDFAIGGNANFCGATGTFVIAQQGFEEISEFEELTCTNSTIGIPGNESGFSTGSSGTGDKPSVANLYFEGSRGYRIQGGDFASASIPSSVVLNFDKVDTSFYTNIELSFNIAAFSLGSNSNGMDNYNAAGNETTVDEDKQDFVLVEISPDNGITWYKQAKVVTDQPQLTWSFRPAKNILGVRDYLANNALNYFISGTNQKFNKIFITNLPSVSQLRVRITAQDNAPNESWLIDNIRLESTGIVPKVWNGSVWSPSAPVKSDKAIINADYNTSDYGDLHVCQCEVNAGTLKIGGGNRVVISDILINNSAVIVENDGNFIQLNEEGVNSGSGTFTVKRNSNLKRLDYTYWSSPVAGQNLKQFSPGTLNSRFYTYNEGNDEFEVINPVINFFGNTTTAFESAAKGYAIRADNNYPAGTPTIPAPLQIFEGIFKGIVNNGPVTFPIKYKSVSTGTGYNLIGNPYASNINFYKLANNNKSVIHKRAYFWTNLNPNPGMQSNNYPNGAFYNNYAILNGTGGIPATSGSNATMSATPTNIIKVGQGFIVQAKQAGTLKFKNAMRTASANSVFFNKGIKEEREPLLDRYWLQLTTPLQVTTTALIGYVEEATNDFDEDYDAPLFVLGADALFSKIEGHELGIQGRHYPMNVNDVISLGTNHYASGTYILSLHKREGIFANGQNIYLKDKQTKIITNLSDGPYAFFSDGGESTGRFEIVYVPETTLTINSNLKENFIIYKDGSDFVIRSSGQNITGVKIFDAVGRLVLKLEGSHKEWRFASQQLLSGIYIVKSTLKTGEVFSRKIRK